MEQPRAQRKNENWQQFVVSAADLQVNWRKHKTDQLKYGSYTLYYCALGSRNCKAQVKVKTFNDGTVISYSNKEEHSNHKEQKGLTSEQKKVISELCMANIDRPTDIIEILKVKRVTVPAKLKLQNFLAYYRRKHMAFGHNIGEVVVWCKQNSTVPVELDKPFVVTYDIHERESSEPTLRIFISTNRLLMLAPNFKHVHADATYKLNRQGYPVLVVGTTDKKRKFHPFGLAICKSEDSEDFKFLFQSLKDGVSTACGMTYSPEVLVADCAEAITNGFKAIFGEKFDRVYCFFHVKKSYDKRLLSISDIKIRNQISDDIMRLHFSASKDIFNAAALLWCDKWSDSGNIQVISFVNYFMRNLVHKAPNWYFGYVGSRNIPITNNALESCNRYIKQIYTKRRTRSLGEYTAAAAKMLADWSEMRSEGAPVKKSVTLCTEFNLNIVRLAYSWKQTNPNIAFQRQRSGMFVGCFSASEGSRIKAHEKTRLLSLSRHLHWKMFNDFVRSEIEHIRVCGSYDDNFSTYSCTCVEFCKTYVCKHVVTFASLNGSYKFPPEAITGGLGQKPRRGRPKKITPALCR